MISILDFNDYRKALQFLMERSEGEARGLQTRLARHMGCQQAYLSRVLAGKAELSQEQTLSVAIFFNLDGLECEYLLVLLGLNRAGTQELKSYYKQRQNFLLGKRLEIKSRIQADGQMSLEARATYYSDWVYAAVHMITAIEKYRSPAAISIRLKMPQEQVLLVLRFLEEHGLVKKKSDRYHNNVGRIHLGNDSTMIKSHHTNWRIQSINNLGRDPSDKINYTSVVTCGVGDAEKIREVMLKAVQQIREIVRESPSEEVYCYNLDFFEV